LQLRNSINITKVTPDIKLELELDQRYSRRRVIEDDFDTTYVTNEFQGDNLFVKSLGEHWSAGIKWNIGTSTRENYGLRTDILPSVEYDLFPYSEATHRQLRFLYSIGMQYIIIMIQLSIISLKRICLNRSSTLLSKFRKNGDL